MIWFNYGLFDCIYAHTTTSRSISFPSFALTPTPVDLLGFTLVSSLSIDFSHEGLVTQQPVVSRLFERINSTQLTSLTLTALPRIDVPLLKLIARTVPHLTTLAISSIERLDSACCEDCFYESASRVIHSPVPDMFAEVGGLAVSRFFLNTQRGLFLLVRKMQARICPGSETAENPCPPTCRYFTLS